MKYSVEMNNSEFVIKERKTNYKVDLRKRLLHFSINTIKFLMTLPNKKEFEVFKYQLSKSATAVGANYEEAQSSSYKEFVQKSRISLREANESKYWFKILDELNIGELNLRKELLIEGNEISLILGSIVSKSQKKINVDL